MRNFRRLVGPAVLIAGVSALVSTSIVAQSTQNQGERSTSQGISQGEFKAPRRVTQKQRDDLAARIELASSIVNRLQAEATARGLSSEWRRATIQTLLPLSRAALERVSQEAFNLDSLVAARAGAAEDPNLIGDPQSDLVYTPVAPCRFIDTRNVGGKINGTVSYDLSTPGATYGGSCINPITLFGVADDEQLGAIAMNVTIVDPSSAPGFVAAKPTAAAPLSSLVNWYEAGPAVQAANQGIITISQTPPDTVINFVLQSSGPVHVIVDFFGAFIEPDATPVDQFIVLNSQAVAASGSFSIFSPVCPAGYRLTGGGHRANFFNAPAQLAASRPAAGNSIAVVSGANAGSQWLCQGTNSATAQDIECYAMCTRIPGR